MHASAQYMLKYDSMHGRFEGSISGGHEEFIVNGRKVAMHACMNAADIPWADSGAEYIVESTGVYTTLEKVHMLLYFAGCRLCR